MNQLQWIFAQIVKNKDDLEQVCIDKKIAFKSEIKSQTEMTFM